MSGLGIAQCCVCKWFGTWTLSKCKSQNEIYLHSVQVYKIHFYSCKWLQMENTKCVTVKLFKFILCHVKECNCKCKNKFIYIRLHNPIKQCIYIYIYDFTWLYNNVNTTQYKKCDFYLRRFKKKEKTSAFKGGGTSVFVVNWDSPCLSFFLVPPWQLLLVKPL